MTQTHKTYGLLSALAMIIIGVIFHITDLAYTVKWAQYISYSVMLVGLVLNAIAYSKANDANITFGQAFSSSFKATALLTLILIAWTLLALYLIFPDMKDRLIEMMVQQMAENGNTQEEIDTGMSMIKKGFNLLIIGGMLFWTMFLGAIFSLIGAAIAKKNPQPKQPA